MAVTGIGSGSTGGVGNPGEANLSPSQLLEEVSKEFRKVKTELIEKILQNFNSQTPDKFDSILNSSLHEMHDLFDRNPQVKNALKSKDLTNSDVNHFVGDFKQDLETKCINASLMKYSPGTVSQVEKYQPNYHLASSGAPSPDLGSEPGDGGGGLGAPEPGSSPGEGAGGGEGGGGMPGLGGMGGLGGLFNSLEGGNTPSSPQGSPSMPGANEPGSNNTQSPSEDNKTDSVLMAWKRPVQQEPFGLHILQMYKKGDDTEVIYQWMKNHMP